MFVFHIINLFLIFLFKEELQLIVFKLGCQSLHYYIEFLVNISIVLSIATDTQTCALAISGSSIVWREVCNRKNCLTQHETANTAPRNSVKASNSIIPQRCCYLLSWHGIQVTTKTALRDIRKKRQTFDHTFL